MADTNHPRTGKRQIARLTKKQLGHEIGRNILNQIANIANGVRDLVDKGHAIDQRSGQRIALQCAPEDIKRSWSTEQLVAVEDFISTWCIDPEPPPQASKPPAPPAEKRSRKKTL